MGCRDSNPGWPHARQALKHSTYYTLTLYIFGQDEFLEGCSLYLEFLPAPVTSCQGLPTFEYPVERISLPRSL